VPDWTETHAAGTADLTFSHTPHASANWIYVLVDNDYLSNGRVSGVTFKGNALTSIGIADNTTGDVEVSLWRLASPTSGAGNVVVSVPAAGGWLRAAAFTAVFDGTTPHRTIATATGFGTPTLSVTSAVGDLVIGGVSAWDSSPSGNGYTAGSGQTAIYHQTGFFLEIAQAISYEDGAASSTTHDYSYSSGNAQYAILGVALNIPAAAAASRVPEPPYRRTHLRL